MGGFLMYGIGPIHRINGIMDQYVCKNIIKNVLLPFAKDHLALNWVLMQDNNPKHKAKSVIKFLEEEKVCLLD